MLTADGPTTFAQRADCIYAVLMAHGRRRPSRISLSADAQPGGEQVDSSGGRCGHEAGMMVQALVGVLLAAAILLAVVAATRAPALRVGGIARLDRDANPERPPNVVIFVTDNARDGTLAAMVKTRRWMADEGGPSDRATLRRRASPMEAWTPYAAAARPAPTPG
jgi:hypothetical protein